MTRALKLALGGSALAAVAGCDERAEDTLVCADPQDMTSAEESVRRTLNYVEVSANPDTVCAGCAFFASSAAGSGCGSCTIFDGRPVNPGGHCDSWSSDA